jgi:hypothetical protein
MYRVNLDGERGVTVVPPLSRDTEEILMLFATNKNGRAAIWTGVILTAGLWAAISGSAAAGTHQSQLTGADATDGSNHHCVVNLSNYKKTCHGSFRAAVADATEGRITDAPQNPAAAARDANFKARINALATVQHNAPSSYVVAIEYANVNFSGESLVVTGSYPCGDTSYSMPDLSANGWSDKIYSFAAYSNCWAMHYENPGFKGARTDWLNSATTLGILNGATSSISWQAVKCPPYCPRHADRASTVPGADNGVRSRG